VSSRVGELWVALSSVMAANMGPWNGSANPRMLLLRTMAWSGPKLQTLTKNGSSGLTSATPRATATDLCRHRWMLGEMVTWPGVAQVTNPFYHSSFAVDLATRPDLSRLVVRRPFPLIGK